MKRFLSVLGILLFCSQFAFANECGPYYPINSNHLPENVKQASDSVFEIRTLHGDAGDFIPQQASDIDWRLIHSNPPDFSTWSLEACHIAQSDTCLTSSSIELGTTFLFEDNSTLVTSLHGIIDYLVAQLNRAQLLNDTVENQINFIKKIKIPVFITSHGSRIRDWNPEASLVDYVQVKELLIDLPLQDYQQAFRSESDNWDSRFKYNIHDVVILKSNRPVPGIPLQPSSQQWLNTQQVYSVGIPPPSTQTSINEKCFTQYPNGFLKYISRGLRITDSDSFPSELLSDENPDFFSIKGTIEKGFSGGPLLDFEGNVLGVSIFRFGRIAHLAVPLN